MENQPFLIGKPSINGPFSMAMLVIARGYNISMTLKLKKKKKTLKNYRKSQDLVKFNIYQYIYIHIDQYSKVTDV
jgi:hypothetical protein